jgi:hypothetical protein
MKQMGGMGGGGGAGGMPGMGGAGGMDMEGRLYLFNFLTSSKRKFRKKVGIKSNQSTFASVTSILYRIYHEYLHIIFN